MYSKSKLIYKYLQYWLSASNGKGHGVHSPFVFKFIKDVLIDDRYFYAYDAIENLRSQLLTDKTQVIINDFGAGSRTGLQQKRMIGQIASSSLKPKKYAQLLFRIADYYKAKNILELGTSLGITTSYLASANESASIITMEGADAIANIAQQNFINLNKNNIEIIRGDFDETLPSLLKKINALDLIYVDGNHRYKPTLNYLNLLLPHCHDNTIMIFDDIHWSAEMEQAWDEIKQNNVVTLSIDLFGIGLIFFRKENKQKEHFTIRF